MSLTEYLIARISADGPLSIADYMSACLLHPDFGYYATRDPFGAAGDFITAPEISQMFGELAGLSLAQAWMDRGGADFEIVNVIDGIGLGFRGDPYPIESGEVLRLVQTIEDLRFRLIGQPDSQ